jgi:hypothetical protein
VSWIKRLAKPEGTMLSTGKSGADRRRTERGAIGGVPNGKPTTNSKAPALIKAEAAHQGYLRSKRRAEAGKDANFGARVRQVYSSPVKPVFMRTPMGAPDGGTISTALKSSLTPARTTPG